MLLFWIWNGSEFQYLGKYKKYHQTLDFARKGCIKQLYIIVFCEKGEWKDNTVSIFYVCIKNQNKHRE